MKRVASLFLPQLPIERLRKAERPSAPPERTPAALPELPVDDDPGPCSVPRGGGWRPGARWAQGEFPDHRRPARHEMGRRSEAADHPFRAMRGDDGVPPLPPPLPPANGSPTILVARTGQRETISAACPAALALGMVPGMAAAHARALVPELDARDAEPEADRAVLDRLALHAAGHWTPNACVAEPDGLWLDLTGTTHLFGGEERFCRRLLRFLARLGFTASVAVAGTPGAAHALARYGGRAITVLPPGMESAALAALPVAALRLTPEALTAAARFGFETVGDLYPVPRGPLARRLGLPAVERLDQARGLTAEPIEPVVPFDLPLAERRLLEPIVTAEAIAQVIGDLTRDLADRLQARALGLRTAVLTCLRVDGEEQRIGFGTAAATRDAAHLARMLGLRIERIDPGLGIERMTLTAPHVEQLAPQALAARLGGEARAPDLAPLVDQLAGRAGAEALFRVGAVESDVPERAVCRAGPLDRPSGWPSWPRPARLLPRPEPLSGVVALLPDHPPRRFTWRGQAYRVTAGDGPERIHGEWWRNRSELWAVRDYFRVEAEDGSRFWLFRRGDGVDAPTGDLSWYVHGLFG